MRLIFLLIATTLLRGTKGFRIGNQRKEPIQRSNAERTVSKIKNSKRQLDIGLSLKLPTTQRTQDLKALEREIIQSLAKEIKGEDMDKISDIAESTSEKQENHEPLLLKPAFECDRWDPPDRTCWLDRNIGDTVTFSLSTSVKVRRLRPDVVWRREFAVRDSRTRRKYVIDPQKSSRNLVIGRRGYELRVSPVTDLDVDDNLFSATFVQNASTPYAKVNFRIRVVAEDLGFVYIGETLDLSIESYVTLPLETMSYRWYTEKDGELATLPSNMRVSSTGETLRISELRQEQEGIIACSIYTNKDVHATKKRFLIKELAKNKDVLKAFSNPGLTFQEENQKRHKKKVEVPRKPINRRSKDSHPKRRKEISPKKSLNAKREVNEANVGGEQYSFVQSNNDGTNNGQQAQADKSFSTEDGMYSVIQNADDNYEGMNFLSIGNSSHSETVINMNLDRDKNMEDDKIAQLVSYCIKDLQCSKHATCVRSSLREKGFCRCLPSFYGPGIFCREYM